MKIQKNFSCNLKDSTGYINEELGFHSESWVSLTGPARWWDGVDVDAAGLGLVEDPGRVREMLDLMNQEELVILEI